jgi:hypothetical protein
MTTLYKYRLFCTTTQTYQFVWNEDKPTTCPENNTHTIDTSSISIVKKIDPAEISIKEEVIPTGGNYQATTVAFSGMTGPTGTVYIEDKSWPHPINAMNISIETTANNSGDMIDVVVAPDTIIGALTNFAATGATGLSVSQTVVDYTMIGYYLELVEGAKIHDCGRVISIDTTNNIIVPEFPPTSTFSPLSTTYVRQSVYTVKGFKCCTPQKFDIGIAKIGGSYVPANTVVRGMYTLNHPTSEPKQFTSMIEYLY